MSTAWGDLRGRTDHGAAAPDEILASATVPALVSGLGLSFEPRGEFELKGFGLRSLFAYAD